MYRLGMNVIGLVVCMMLLVDGSLGLSDQKVVKTAENGDTDDAHMRTKRGILTAVKELGCLAFTTVKECTQELNSCGDFCNIVHSVCSVASVSSGLSSLCNDVNDYKPVVMNDYRIYSHKNWQDAERLMTMLGGDIEKNSSIGKKIVRFFKRIWHHICSWFQ